jgi:hypothetical protein
MPLNIITTLHGVQYPLHKNYNLCDLNHAVFNRYYQSYIGQLSSTGYNFPPVDTYREIFDRPLQASFVCKAGQGLHIDPGPSQRWVVFIHTKGDVLIFVARYVMCVKNTVQLFGDIADSIQYKLDKRFTFSGVAVTVDAINGLRAAGAFIL